MAGMVLDAQVVCVRGVGPLRGGRVGNEDNYLIVVDGHGTHLDRGHEVRRPQSGDGLLIAVADGMGGHAHGALASAAAVRGLARVYGAAPPPGEVEDLLREHVLGLHHRLRRRVRAAGSNMGTTLTTAWVLDGVCTWVHVGDSRLYLSRQGELRRLSHDHTRAEFARRLNRAPPRAAGYLAQNLIFGSRGLGDDKEVRIDPGIDTGSEPVQVGDRLLLCSDGVSGFVGDAELSVVLSTPAATAAELASRVVAAAESAGSDDNITALVVKVQAGA